MLEKRVEMRGLLEVDLKDRDVAAFVDVRSRFLHLEFFLFQIKWEKMRQSLLDSLEIIFGLGVDGDPSMMEEAHTKLR